MGHYRAESMDLMEEERKAMQRADKKERLRKAIGADIFHRKLKDVIYDMLTDPVGYKLRLLDWKEPKIIKGKDIFKPKRIATPNKWRKVKRGSRK